MNWITRLIGYFVFSFLLAKSSLVFSQNSSLEIIKESCLYNNKYRGGKLIIAYQTDTLNLKSGIEYWLNDFIRKPDSIKLRLIEKLLTYEGDTSLCCMNVVSRSFNGIEGCGGKPKGVTRYSIQIDALYMINRLCWPQWMELYSCVPVLYDTKLNKQINDDIQKVRYVYARYKEWYKECKKTGKISQYFPFNDGRYIWYGGIKSGVAKDY